MQPSTRSIEFTREQVEALEELRRKLNFTPEELEEFGERQRLHEAVLREVADAPREEGERLADLAWEKMHNPETVLPADATPALRAYGAHFERRQARTQVAGARRPMAVILPRTRARECRPGATRRESSSSRTSSTDPGGDPDQPPGPSDWECLCPTCELGLGAEWPAEEVDE